MVDVAADNLWVIGTVQHPGYFKVLNANIANYPEENPAVGPGRRQGAPRDLVLSPVGE